MKHILESIFTERNKMSQDRLAICSVCDKYNKKTTRCEECGCFMEYKTLFRTSKCPIGKWKENVT